MRIIALILFMLSFITGAMCDSNESIIQEWLQWHHETLYNYDLTWDGKSEITNVPDQADYWKHLAYHDLKTESYIINPQSQYYSVIDGVLFSEDMSILYRYPPMRSDKCYIIPDTVLRIEESAFTYCFFLEEVVIPNSVKSIGTDAFNRSRIKKIVIPESVVDFDIESISQMPELIELDVVRDSIVWKTLEDAVEYIDFFKFGKVQPV